MKTNVWHKIDKRPKNNRPGHIYVYRFKPEWNERRREWTHREDFRLDRLMGSRVCTHFMIIPLIDFEADQ